MKFDYRYRVRPAPFLTDGRYTEYQWNVYVGDGSYSYTYSTHLTKTGARITAWWRNRRRGFGTCGATRFRRAKPTAADRQSLKFITFPQRYGAPPRVLNSIEVTSVGPVAGDDFDSEYVRMRYMTDPPPWGLGGDYDGPPE